MKITEIKAYRVENTYIDASNGCYAPYWRVEDNGQVAWLTNVQISPEHLLSITLMKLLEQQFKETNGVMNEQLSLF